MNETRPIKNDDLVKLYERLCAILLSLPDNIGALNLSDGSGEKFNSYIDQAISLTQDATLIDFKLQTHRVGNHTLVSGEAYSRQLNAVAQYLFQTNEVIGYYCARPSVIKASGAGSGLASTTVNNHLNAEQTASQTTNVQVEFNQTIISMTESLTNFERDHPDESSKENRFAKALKKALPAVKGSLEILSLVLKIAGDIGLSPHVALRAIGLSS